MSFNNAKSYHIFWNSPSKIPFSNCFYPKTQKDSFNDDYLSTDGWEQNKFTVDEALPFSLIVAEDAVFQTHVFVDENL